MTLYYFESYQGCGIREARTLEQARKNVLAEVGYANFKTVRKAEKTDVAWVRAMGGRVPEGDKK